jgi:hypothetical protein
MRTIIAGSRDYEDREFINKTLNSLPFTPSVVLNGKCRGPDSLGETWALSKGIEVLDYPADWNANGKAAGPIRNKEMARNADACVLFITRDKHSFGSLNMLQIAIDHKLEIHVYWV